MKTFTDDEFDRILVRDAALLDEAIWAMEEVKDYIVERLERAPGVMNTVVALDLARRDPDYRRAQAFLARPDVQAWRARQKDTQ